MDSKHLRKTERSEEDKSNLIKRLNIIEGQIRGMRGMVENGTYCVNILIQSAAVKAAIDSFNRDLLANHIKNCVVRDLKDGKEEIVDELLNLIVKLMK